MDKKKLEKLLKNMDSDVKVPKGLAAKISSKVQIHGKKLERKRLAWSVVKLGMALLILIYGFTATVLSFMSSNLSILLSAFTEQPSLIWSYDGVRALAERLPVLSCLILFAAGVYVLRHIVIKGLKRSPNMFATAMASFAIVIMTGAFVSGMAIGVNSGESVQTLAGNTIFAPVVSSANDREFSFSGTVLEVSPVEDGAILQIDTANGKRMVNINYKELHKNAQTEGTAPLRGDKIFVIGVPDGDSLKVTFVKTF